MRAIDLLLGRSYGQLRLHNNLTDHVTGQLKLLMDRAGDYIESKEDLTGLMLAIANDHDYNWPWFDADTNFTVPHPAQTHLQFHSFGEITISQKAFSHTFKTFNSALYAPIIIDLLDNASYQVQFIQRNTKLPAGTIIGPNLTKKTKIMLSLPSFKQIYLKDKDIHTFNLSASGEVTGFFLLST